jgi:hypothetical protein
MSGNISRRACGYVSDLIRCLLTAFSRLERFETKIRGILDNLDAFPPMDWGHLILFTISMSSNSLVSIGKATQSLRRLHELAHDALSTRIGMTFGGPAGTVPLVMITFGAPNCEPKSCNVGAFDVQFADCNLARWICIAWLLRPVLEDNSRAARGDMHVVGGDSHRLNVVRSPLHIVGYHLDGAGHLDDFAFDIVHNVLACQRAQPKKDTMMKSVLIQQWLFGSDLEAPTLTETQKSGVERSEPHMLIGRLAVCTSCPIPQ